MRLIAASLRLRDKLPLLPGSGTAFVAGLLC
jgi:hypothetical protein